MKVSSIADIFGAVLTIALATTILRRASGTAQVLAALGNSFSGVINAAQD